MSNSISSASLSVAAAATSNRADSSRGISVEGNKISWPDDGWYEVQSATSFNTMSEGGTSAEVPHGNYNVINHTTGERFENVVVGLPRRELDTHPIKNPDIPIVNPANPNPSSWENPGASGTLVAPPGYIDYEIELDTVAAIIDAQNTRPDPGSNNESDLNGDGAVSGAESAEAGGFGNAEEGEFGGTPNAPAAEPVSGAESAEAGGFGNAEEGEFGGTPTAPAAEPVSQPTTTQRPSGNSWGSSDSDSNSSNSSGGMSSSQSAEEGGYGTSEQGEFG